MPWRRCWLICVERLAERSDNQVELGPWRQRQRDLRAHDPTWRRDTSHVRSSVTYRITTTAIGLAPNNPTRPSLLERNIHQAIPATELRRQPDQLREMSGSSEEPRVELLRQLGGRLHKPRSRHVGTFDSGVIGDSPRSFGSTL